MTDRFGTDVATRKEQIEGTWTVDGEEYALLTEDTTKETLELIEDYMALAEEISQAESPDDIPEDAGEDLPDFPWEDEDDDKDIVESVVGAKLIKPDVDPQQTLAEHAERFIQQEQRNQQESGGSVNTKTGIENRESKQQRIREAKRKYIQ